MSRLIDADELKHRMETVEMFGLNGLMKVARGMVIVSPTVDAVPVVRCKDCVYWGAKVVYASGERADCLNFNFVTPCDFFCKWGERREDGKAN